MNIKMPQVMIFMGLDALISGMVAVTNLPQGILTFMAIIIGAMICLAVQATAK